MALNDGNIDRANLEHYWEQKPGVAAHIGVAGSPVSAGNPLPTLDFRPPADDRFHLLSANGSVRALPVGAVALEVLADSADGWVRFGDATLTAFAAPTGEVATGAPERVPAGSSCGWDVRGVTHYALVSTGVVSGRIWLAEVGE